MCTFYLNKIKIVYKQCFFLIQYTRINHIAKEFSFYPSLMNSYRKKNAWVIYSFSCIKILWLLNFHYLFIRRKNVWRQKSEISDFDILLITINVFVADPPYQTMDDITKEDFTKLFDLNVVGYFLISKVSLVILSFI